MLRRAVRFANSASSIRTLTVGSGFAPDQPIALSRGVAGFGGEPFAPAIRYRQ